VRVCAWPTMKHLGCDKERGTTVISYTTIRHLCFPSTPTRARALMQVGYTQRSGTVLVEGTISPIVHN